VKRRAEIATRFDNSSDLLRTSWQNRGRDCAHCVLSVRQPPELVGRAYRFSLAALRFYRKLPKSPDAQVPGVQFYKAATSMWSNYRASQLSTSFLLSTFYSCF